MDQRTADTPEPVLGFSPKQKAHAGDSPLDEAGKAIVAQIQRAADLASSDCDRAMNLAHKLSMELRASEDRMHQLQVEVDRWRDRAGRAEQWLRIIQKEIEEKLIAPKSSSGAEQASLH
jgi:hypothetical protein